MALYAFDGTWNEDKPGADKDTNVVWFRDAYIGSQNYWEGVGTRFGLLGKLFGGITGAGAH
ncbi:MAG: phospholipase effector Tle1 domain-containing protein, partial [Bryobacteraceae bacterium]